MSNYIRLCNNLDSLSLTKIKEYLPAYLDEKVSSKMSTVDILLDLTDKEVDFREKRAAEINMSISNFPFIKTFEDFNFNFQPSINKEQILNFKYLKFIENRENIIFIGSHGVGKTHLATSIGIEAAKARVSTYFISCGDLLLQLKRAHLENRLKQRIKFFSKYKLLIIDEVGFLPLDIESSNLLFQLIAKRYEKNSTIVTTNKPLSRWGEIFGDPVLANAILDRLLHHSNVINIVGRLYRTKDIIEDDN